MGTGSAADVRFEGRPIERRPGETLLRALARRGLPVLQRSIRYHRPRAPFCGIGACTQCLVRVNGLPNVRACQYVPSAGDRIDTENAWPSPRHDMLGVLDRIFRHGIDTSHGFRRPRFAAPIYQRVVRRLAGYGRLSEAIASPPLPAGERIDTDALVIGGGGSGAAAARTLADQGARTVVADRSSSNPLVEGTRWISGATVTFLPPPVAGRTRPFRAILTRPGGPAGLVEASRVVLAPGGYDGPLLFPGNDRPGVMTAEGALALAPPDGLPPWDHALLFGGGSRVVEMLDRFGDQVEAVAAPGTVHGEIAERAARLEIPVFPRTLLTEATGSARVRAVRLRTRGGGPTTSLPVDSVILAHRRVPNAQLFYQAGARMEWRRSAGAYFPSLSEDGATSVPGLWAAGSAAGFRETDRAASGVQAATASLGRPIDAGALSRIPIDDPGELEGYYRELLADRRGGKWVLCACEDVLLGEVEEAVRHGYRGIEVIKRLTSTGTGLCQGRYCLPDALLLLAQFEGRSPAEVGYITQRPPVFPTPLEALAALPEPDEGGTP